MEVVTEHALDALLERLVDPLLRELDKSRLVQATDEQLLARQLHGLASLYYGHLCDSFSGLEPLDATQLCRKLVILRMSLLNYLPLDDRATVVKTKLHEACGGQNAATKVAALLLSSNKEYCLIVKGLVTKSVWSLIEVEAEQGDSNPFDLAVSAVQNHAGIERSAFDSANVFYRRTREGSLLYRIVCKEDAEVIIRPSSSVEEAIWIPVNELLARTQPALLDTSGWGVSPSPAIDYFHILPFSCYLHQSVSMDMGPSLVEVYPKEVKNANPVDQLTIKGAALKRADTTTGNLPSERAEENEESICKRQKRSLEVQEALKNDGCVVEQPTTITEEHCNLELKCDHIEGKLQEQGQLKLLFNLKDAVQELDEFCSRNGWQNPIYNYKVQASPHRSAQNLYTVTVELSGNSISGTSCLDHQEAKQSAASRMLGTLYLIRAKTN